MRLYIWSRTVSHGLSRSCTIANTIIHGHGTRVSFSYTAFTDTLEWPESNSDKATVGSVVCTVYTDGNRISHVFCVRQALGKNSLNHFLQMNVHLYALHQR